MDIYVCTYAPEESASTECSTECVQIEIDRYRCVQTSSNVVSLKSCDLYTSLLPGSDCPVSEIEDYRVEVLIHLRKLERLDKDPFSSDERVDAEEVCVCLCLRACTCGGAPRVNTQTTKHLCSSVKQLVSLYPADFRAAYCSCEGERRGTRLIASVLLGPLNNAQGSTHTQHLLMHLHTYIHHLLVLSEQALLRWRSPPGQIFSHIYVCTYS